MIEELRVNIKPLSVNRAWQGRRYKTDAYEAYEMEMLLRLPAGRLPEPPYRVFYEFGFSNKLSDYDNPVKWAAGEQIEQLRKMLCGYAL